MSEWNLPTIIELADGTKCVRLEDFLKNEGYKELYEVAKGRIEQLQSERDELRDTVADVLLALGAFDYGGPRMAALRVVAERKSLQDQRDFAMGEIQRLKKEAARKDKLLSEMRAAIRWAADDSCKGWLQ